MKKIKQGYKQTEIGVIPVDWEVKYFGNICDIHVGRDLLEKNFSIFKTNEYIYPVFSNTVSNYGLYGYYKNPEYNFEGFTVVGRGVGLGTAFYRKAKFGAIGRLLVLKPEKDNAKFLTYYVNNKISIFLESGGIPQLTGISFSKYKIPLPPLPEQKAIAQVLSDTDDLIQALEQKLAKKRAIKQGAMQQLLAPKEDWEVRKLEEVVDFLDNQRKPIKSSERESMRGEYPYYGASGIIDYVNDYIFDDELILLGEDGENILSRNSPLAFKVSGKIWVNNHAHVLKTKNGYSTDFLTAYLESLDYTLLNTGTAQPKLNKKVCQNINLHVPSLQEQTQIATILSDMDTEIEQIETQLSKYKQIKQGLMQNLLTGKIRLTLDSLD